MEKYKGKIIRVLGFKKCALPAPFYKNDFINYYAFKNPSLVNILLDDKKKTF